MQIVKKRKGTCLTAVISGKIDTITAPELDAALHAECEDVEELVLDFAQVPYISSAGLRIVLRLHKKMKDKGGLRICHVNEVVMETFAMTGFAQMLTIERG